MNKIIIILFVMFICLTTSILIAQDKRGLKVVITNNAGESVGTFKESHAFLIGISKYTKGWPNLPAVKKDIKRVKKAYDSFINTYGLDKDNRLLFSFCRTWIYETISLGRRNGLNYKGINKDKMKVISWNK